MELLLALVLMVLLMFSFRKHLLKTVRLLEQVITMRFNDYAKLLQYYYKAIQTNIKISLRQMKPRMQD